MKYLPLKVNGVNLKYVIIPLKNEDIVIQGINILVYFGKVS